MPPDFRAWVRCPACLGTGAACHAARRVDNLAAHSPAIRTQGWQRCVVKDTTRGPLTREYKAAAVHLGDSSAPDHNIAVPTDRRYRLMVTRQPRTGEIKYVVSNAGAGVPVQELIRVLLSRWHVEKWFERAKQE